MNQSAAATIVRLCVNCQQHFVTVSYALEVSNKRIIRDELSNAIIENELRQFRIWASNIGVLNIGRASLDYRLRDAEYLYQNVKSLLEDLKQCLEEDLFELFFSN
jgi:hypothetical protein